MQITSLLINLVHIYAFPLPSLRTLQQKCTVSSEKAPNAWQQLFYSSLGSNSKGLWEFCIEQRPKKHKGAHLGPSRCGKPHERLLPGSKLPWLAFPKTCRHPYEWDNQQQTHKKDLPEGCACVHFHTLYLQYISEPT